jgi:hypothetical protein
MIATWMETSQTIKWSGGLRFAQAMEKKAYQGGIKCSSYEEMFGCLMKVGLATFAVPQDLIKNYILKKI